MIKRERVERASRDGDDETLINIAADENERTCSLYINRDGGIICFIGVNTKIANDNDDRLAKHTQNVLFHYAPISIIYSGKILNVEIF